ncbi:hypothetical protein ACFDTO_10355 [Microbacteriaceae bacterium 4G12]
MHTTRLRLEGKSIEELKARVLEEHGPAARIVAAERITVGGVAGFFAKRHFEVSVEVGAPSATGSRVVIDAPARAGIAALLADAEEQEVALQLGALRGAGAARAAAGASAVPASGAGSAGRSAAPSVLGVDDSVPSTRTPAFAELLQDLSYNAPSPVAPEPLASPSGRVPAADTATLLPVPVPAPLRRPGDLVLVIGLAADAVAVATAMAASVGSASVCASGSAPGWSRVDDRRGALAARAQGVERGESAFVACGWGADALAVLSAVGPDQVWVAVDAGRKPEDTARWVAAVASAIPIDAVATVGSADTATPETVEELGLPIGWVDDRPARSRAA